METSSRTALLWRLGGRNSLLKVAATAYAVICRPHSRRRTLPRPEASAAAGGAISLRSDRRQNGRVIVEISPKAPAVWMAFHMDGRQ